MSKTLIPSLIKLFFDDVVRLTDKFCQTNLNDEYQLLCRQLAGVLARKRPSPSSVANLKFGPVASCESSAGSIFSTTEASNRT